MRGKAQIPSRRLPRNFPVRGSFGEVGVMEFGLKGTSRICRGRHEEVGIVEFGLKDTRMHASERDVTRRHYSLLKLTSQLQ